MTTPKFFRDLSLSFVALCFTSLASAQQASKTVAGLTTPPLLAPGASTKLLPYADCDPLLASLKTQHTRFGDLCSLAHRYHVALGSLEREGLSPADRMADLMGPRFIDLPKWLAGDIAAKFDPVHFYQPAPITWVTWERGLRIVKATAAQGVATNVIMPVTFDWLKALHIATMTGVMDPGETPGALRPAQEVGPNLKKVDAITAAQAQEIANGDGYRNILQPSQPLISWHPKICVQDLTPEQLKTLQAEKFDFVLWPKLQIGQTFLGPDGQQRQCGITLYSDHSEVQPQLEAWFTFINTALSQIQNGRMDGDAMEFFARIQRWFIAIHPFNDGNGRMSRFALEAVTTRLGLPPPIFAEMDNDILTPEAQWADQVAEGMWRTVRVAEICAANPKKGGCNVVPVPDGVVPQ